MKFESEETKQEKIPQIEWKKFSEYLGDLSETESLSGNENEIRTQIEEKLRQLGIETSVDEKGNLWVKSAGPQGEFLLCAHMDKIGKGSRTRTEGSRITGRLDNALGISLILNLFREGYRPSALFTVEEESQREVINQEEGVELISRDLPGSIYNAGARHVADKMIDAMFERSQIPKMVIVIDVSTIGKIDNGPLIYMSGSSRTGGAFRFPSGPLKDTVKLLRRNDLQAHFIEGRANDAIEFSFVKGLGVLAIEIPIKNYHSPKEVASVSDIELSAKILRTILENPDNFISEAEIPLHAQKIYKRPKQQPIELPPSAEE